MPNLHDIERRIGSVKSTMQITRTMEMVAAAKIRHASVRVQQAAPYADSMAEMLANVATRVGDSDHALLKSREEVKNILLIVVVSDRGLAGGFNSNVLRHAEEFLNKKRSEGAQVQVVACGKKAVGYFTYREVEPVLSFISESADPTVEQATTVANYAIKGYEEGTIDEVVLLYNHSRNAAEQTLREEQVLPVDTEALLDTAMQTPLEDSETINPALDFEPGAEAVLTQLVPSYVRTMIFRALVDSAAGEQGARRNAMHSATENANDMVETLTRIYNRVRQSAITTEISEIVGGAAALEE